jgi:hypothetical protein
MKKIILLITAIVLSINVFAESPLTRNKLEEYVEDRRNGVYSGGQQRIGGSSSTDADPIVGEPLVECLALLSLLGAVYAGVKAVQSRKRA